MPNQNIVPNNDEEGGIGTSLKRWLNSFFKYIDLKCYIDFSSMTAPAHKEGRVFYDETEHTLSVYNENSQVTHNLGQETLLRVFNNTGSLIDNGVAVRVSGSTGNVPEISLALADTIENANCVGVTTSSIPDQNYGYITIAGIVNDIDTSSFSEGDKLFISETTPGALVNVAPSIESFIGYVITVHANNGIIFTNCTPPTQNTGDMLKSVYDINDDGIVDKAYSQSHEYAESEGESSTTNTILQTKTTLIFTPPTTGDYIIEWYCEVNASQTNRRINLQVDINDSTVIAGLLEEESPLAAYPAGWKPISGLKKINLSNVSQSVKIKFATETGTSTAYIRNARILAKRVH